MINIKVELTKVFIGDVLVTAFDGQYGGCWEWASPAGRFWLESEDDIWTLAYIVEDEDEAKVIHKIDAEAVERGIQKIIDMDVPIRDDLFNQVSRAVLHGDADIDAHAVDCIIQAAVFGELVYS